MTNLSLGNRVKLVSFWGGTSSGEPVIEEENYWSLIGLKGVVISGPAVLFEDFSESYGPSYLIKFDESIAALGLYCHNEIENSLWIFENDLVQLIE